MSCMRSTAVAAAAMSVLAASSLAQVRSLQPDSGRDCAVCHVSWVDSYKRSDAVLLMDKPADSLVSESETCLGCHDGSVADSRRRVWLEHGHQTGITPPADMKVPEMLPLNDGKLACRTCHTAHSGAGPETLASSIFLRMRNDSSQLCQSCHTGHTKGPELGTHPIGGMPWPVPKELIAAGARPGPDPQRLICQTCHTPHGAREEHLLVMGTQSSQLCLTCHAKLRPGFWRPDTGREHPQNPPLSSDAQRQAIRDLGTKTGPGDTLICLSCHKLHHGRAGRSMLADTQHDSSMCLRCHPGRATMFTTVHDLLVDSNGCSADTLHDSSLCLRCHPGRTSLFSTVHDLRTSAPNERNRLGEKPEESGPCGACHSFHQFARRPDPQPLDPTGLCATCHQQGQCAEKASGLPFSHPTDVQQKDLTGTLKLILYGQPDDPEKKSLACLTCHDPHETQHPHFLRGDPENVCAACHSEKVAALPAAHDFTTHSELKNARQRTGVETGKCGFCHGVHNALGPKMWIATTQADAGADGGCVACHQAGGMGSAKIAPELRHPHGPSSGEKTAAMECKLPLFNETGQRSETGFVTCASCHDPHGGLTGSTEMLRQTDAHDGTTLCAQCHAEAKIIHASMHNSAALAAHFENTRYCNPCHTTHAHDGVPAADGMWAAPLGPLSQAPGIEKCTGCHGLGGAATRITPTVHPAVALQNLNDTETPGCLPLVGPDGQLGVRDGSITCQTCHLPHGNPSRVVDDPTVTNDAGDITELTLEQLRGLKPMIRPFEPPNLCTTCHGFDAMRRFLFYHAPSKRKSAVNEEKP